MIAADGHRSALDFKRFGGRMLDIDRILDRDLLSSAAPTGIPIGRSRDGRAMTGYAFGRGPLHVSLIAGCHADEPVGPAMLDRLVSYLGALAPDDPLTRRFSWWLVPHVNPDGEAANQAWTGTLPESKVWCRESPPVIPDLATYLRGVVRERPGDDVEFGFPRSEDDAGARPETRAVADFLSRAGELALHGSFHGMGFAAGPWFLIEHGWADRTGAMRDALRRLVEDEGYRVHDIDRGGDKGFHRIDRGFTSRPDSRAMIRHFEQRGDSETASLFRPSSMEWVRAQGGDPLTLVSEMPLFLLPPEAYAVGDPIRPPMLTELRDAFADGDQALDRAMETLGVLAMPFRDQMRFQLAFLDQALRVVLEQRS